MAEAMAPNGLSNPPSESQLTQPIPVQESKDIELNSTPSKNEPTASSLPVSSESSIEEYNDNSNIPHMSLPKLFLFFFYNFGLFAWGGPVAQIALIKDRLVIQDKWIALPRFQRVFSVYQILPGPEAAELCMFFGCLSAGRLGGLVAGLGFILPGFVLMLLASWVYWKVGFGNVWFNASFRALQPVVGAMILRATHKIADHSVINQTTKKTDPFLIIAALCTAVNGALRINIFISLFLYGILYALITRRWFIPAAILFILQYVTFVLYVVFRGFPTPVSLALGIAPTPSLLHLFLLGLVAGSLSFGGAYTAIPFIQVEAVLRGAWLPQNVFIDCIAIGNILPAPLVIFATFVGFQGGVMDGGVGTGFAGAVVITLGMFFPCFLFTILGHELLEKAVRNKVLAAFFDGLCGSVVGVIAIVAIQILKSSIEGTVTKIGADPAVIYAHAIQVGPAAALYLLALGVLYKFTNKWTAIVMLAAAAVAGQFIFV